MLRLHFKNQLHPYGIAFASVYAKPLANRDAIKGVIVFSRVRSIVVRGDLDVIATLRIQEGDAWALVAVVTWAVQAFMTRWKPRTIDIMPFMTALAVGGVIVMAPLYVWETITVKPMPFDWIVKRQQPRRRSHSGTFFDSYL